MAAIMTLDSEHRYQYPKPRQLSWESEDYEDRFVGIWISLYSSITADNPSRLPATSFCVAYAIA
ncbi:hypothetical protein N7528_001100 [Penicillium herquei]|nr:hypothetical protein N7528_001100 [Penicillium herquei]